MSEFLPYMKKQTTNPCFVWIYIHPKSLYSFVPDGRKAPPSHPSHRDGLLSLRWVIQMLTQKSSRTWKKRKKKKDLDLLSYSYWRIPSWSGMVITAANNSTQLIIISFLIGLRYFYPWVDVSFYAKWKRVVERSPSLSRVWAYVHGKNDI